MMPAVGQGADHVALFDEAVAIVEEQFFDPGMNGVDWAAAVAEHRVRMPTIWIARHAETK